MKDVIAKSFSILNKTFCAKCVQNQSEKGKFQRNLQEIHYLNRATCLTSQCAAPAAPPPPAAAAGQPSVSAQCSVRQLNSQFKRSVGIEFSRHHNYFTTKMCVIVVLVQPTGVERTTYRQYVAQQYHFLKGARRQGKTKLTTCITQKKPLLKAHFHCTIHHCTQWCKSRNSIHFFGKIDSIQMNS